MNTNTKILWLTSILRVFVNVKTKYEKSYSNWRIRIYRKQSYKIFIVDDDIKFLDVISRKLSNMGYTVKTTNSGVNALSKIKKFKALHSIAE